MANNTRVNELQEKLLQAMDIINAQALSHMSFDQTIVCTIKEDAHKKEGRYTVVDDSKIFEAYSNDTSFRIDDQVYVTIPQGDFNNQKLIIGKKADISNMPFIHTNPLDSMLDMTDNIVLEQEEINGALIANALDKYTNTPNNQYITLFNKSCDYYGFTRIGLKAKFKSWIKNAVRGEYGLAIILTANSPNTVSNNTANQTQDYYYTLSNYDMYGNPYNFETDYKQQLVIPIEQIKGTITNIKINFYQEANFFDKYNEPIECSQKGFKLQENTNLYELDADGDYQLSDNDTLLEPNIFVSDIGLYLGYDITNFTQSMVELYTQNSITYKHSNSVNDAPINNTKILKTRWIHVDHDEQPIDMIKAIEKGEKNIQYEVRWYRYKVGAVADDAYSGVYWTRINEATGFTYAFNPDINLQQEKIKIIILYNNMPYYSNELIFENEQNVPLSAEAYHIQNALTIQADDDTNGNYLIYGQDNSIKDTEYSNQIRTLSAWLDVNNSGKIEDNEQITTNSNTTLVWRFPAKNSMIELMDVQKEEIIDNGGNVFHQVVAQQPQYKIASYFSPSKTNNTITCEYTVNGRVYTTQKEFTFGVAGTMGSDQTLIIDFLGDKNFVQANHYDINAFQVQLYDNQNIQQIIPDGEVTWAWYYNSDLAKQGKTFPHVIVEPEPGKEETHQVIIQTNDGLEDAPMKEKEITITTFIEGAKNSILTFSNQLFDTNGLYILQATVGKLTTYFPIPVSNGNYSHITGPTQVIYQSNGEPAYNRDEYKLHTTNSEVLNVVWSIVTSAEVYTYKYLGKIEEEQYNKYGECFEFESENSTTGIRQYKKASSYNSNIEYYQRIENGYCGAINNNRLQPLSVYVEDAPIYGIQAKVGETIAWTQPVLVLQNQWPNGVINKWDGKSLVMDQETSTILAAAISAGKKNSDNTFSGVMIGDWGGQDVSGDISKQTGVYGFHHGAMSYAFKEDGTAFIGKSSMARINFDGNESTIYSAGYKDTITNPGGMMINLFNGGNPYISLKSPGNKKSDSYSEMKLDTKAGGSTIYMKKGNGQDITITNSGDIPLQVGSKFKVYWNGDIEANGGSIGNWNILSSGALQSNDEKITLNTASDGSIVIGNLSSGKITINASGNGSIVMSNKSYLTGGTIYASTLSSNSGNGTIYLDGYLEVLNNGSASNTFLGYIQANTGNWWSDRFSNGVGFGYGEVSSPNAVVKATSKNVGLSFANGGWISIDANGIHFGTKNNLPSEQTGIYARFA